MSFTQNLAYHYSKARSPPNFSGLLALEISKPGSVLTYGSQGNPELAEGLDNHLSMP